MTYSVAWDETVPAGSTDARFIDDRIRDRQTAIRERLCDVFGGLTLTEWQDDPIKVKGLRGGGGTDLEVIGGTDTTTIKDSTETNNDLQVDHSTGDVTARRDLVAGRYIIADGGFRLLLDGWTVDDVAASVGETEIIRAQGRPFMVRSGSILSIGAVFGDDQIPSNGSLTVEVWKASVNQTSGARTEVATGLSATLLVGATRAWAATSQGQDTDTFEGGDELFVKYTTDSLWAPATADLRVVVEVET